VRVILEIVLPSLLDAVSSKKIAKPNLTEGFTESVGVVSYAILPLPQLV
jgi:hypothetical protein